MKSYLQLKRLQSPLLNGLLGLFSVGFFLVIVALLIIPYHVVKLLACYTPLGRMPISESRNQDNGKN